jgi:hypothetical protein
MIVMWVLVIMEFVLLIILALAVIGLRHDVNDGADEIKSLDDDLATAEDNIKKVARGLKVLVDVRKKESERVVPRPAVPSTNPIAQVGKHARLG